MQSSELNRAAKHWNNVTKKNAGQGEEVKWWQSATIWRHINKMTCGEPITGADAGFNKRLCELGPFNKAISVGCGGANKEIILVSQGIVESFDLFEISEERVGLGRAKIKSQNLDDRMHYSMADAFSVAIPGSYDLVYWSSALHHMMDTRQAIEWSNRMLKPGGWFVMFDFIGPTRWQWSDYQIDIIRKVRGILPESFKVHPVTGEPLEIFNPHRARRSSTS